MHQIASFKTTFSKKLQLLRGAHPPSDTPLRRASATAGAYVPFLTSSIWPPHFEIRSAAYGSSKSGKEGTMKIVYGNCYSFTHLWCVMIREIHLSFVVKISKQQVSGFVYFSVHVTLIEQRMKIRSIGQM